MNGRVQASSSLRVFAAVVVTVVVLRYAQEVFVPLALAILMTFLLAPLVEKLQRLHVNRVVAVILTVGFSIVVLGGLAWVVLHQLADLLDQLPHYQRQLRANLADLTSALRGGVSQTAHAVEQLTRELNRAAPAATAAGEIPKVQVISPAPGGMAALRAYIEPFVKPLGTAALVIVFVIFMLLRLPDLRDRVIGLLGPKNLRLTTEALDEAAGKVSRFIVVLTLINAWQGFWVAVGLYLIGLPSAILWGALTMLLRFVPYVGIWVAAALPVALSFAVFDNWVQPVVVAGYFIGLELLSYAVLEPWLVGSRTGISPIALLVAVAFWAWLWGPIGLLLAIPVTVCLVVMGKYIPQLGFLHLLLGDQPALAAHERLYQRLLARNRDEADELVEESLRTQSRVEVCDAVIVPALQLAEDDHYRGLLPDEKRLAAFEHVQQWADDFADMAERPAASEDNPASGGAPGPAVLCVPAEDEADLITAKLLAALLREQGARSRIAPDGYEEEVRPDVVVVSALPPDAVTAARRVCRALRLRWHDVPIIVGLWNALGDSQRARQRLEAVGASQVCTSLAECLALIGAPAARAPRVAEGGRVANQPAY